LPLLLYYAIAAAPLENRDFETGPCQVHKTYLCPNICHNNRQAFSDFTKQGACVKEILKNLQLVEWGKGRFSFRHCATENIPWP
jgi:hypothetical protein